MVTVTVAIPTFNVVRTIEDCLNSVMSRDFPADQMQVVVGDNGSTDGTFELIRSTFPGVELIVANERGSGYARNVAFAAARGQYICSTDADCITDPGWLSAFVRSFEQSPKNVACLGGQILPYRTETIVERYRPAWIQQAKLRDGKDTLVYAETPNAAYRRSVLSEVGYFDGTQGMDDTDLGIRLTASGFSIQYAPEAIVRHRNPSSLRELFYHRRKYGIFMTRLARKYPDRFGSPDTPTALARLALQTTRRVIVDLTYKLPRAVVLGKGVNGTRLGPALDAVIAIANYIGVRCALQEKRG